MKSKTKAPILESGAVPLEMIEDVNRFPDVYQIFQADRLATVEEQANRIILTAENGIALEINWYSEAIVRIRQAHRGVFERDFLYAVDPAFSPKKVACQLKEEKTYIALSTDALHLRIAKKGLKVSAYEPESKRAFLSEAAPASTRSTILKGVDQTLMRWKIPAKAHYYGLGDKAGKLNLMGRRYENWCTDSFGYSAESSALYRSIPFYYGQHGKTAFGLLLNNTYRSFFDFGRSQKQEIQIETVGGQLDYFLIAGPRPIDVAMRYHELTGKPELPPLWSLGFHQCRWSYYPEARVRALAETFRKLDIPCDAIYLDIDYMDGYRCFTWNDQHFPDPKRLISDLRKQGFETVVMIDPGIKVDQDYHTYVSGVKADVFCRRTDGEMMHGPVWPPSCVWPDYTRPEVRDWWGQQYKTLYKSQGVSGFWNDMNEPAVFQVNNLTFPDTVMHDMDGAPRDHRAAHNIYGMQMSRATYEGLKALKPKVRPFVLTRATFCGGQRFAAVWTGDNVASWEHLHLANIQCQRLSISGFSFCGTDIGGFVDLPSGELMVRWLQLGVFHPLYRVHSMGNNVDGAAEVDADLVTEAERLNRLDQEPWAFGQPYTDHARAAIALRYRLLPYLYTSFYQHTISGMPFLQPLSFVDPDWEVAHQRENEFLVGHDLLVTPVTREGAKSVQVALPEGEWYDYHSGRYFGGRQKIRKSVKADTVPMYVRAGCVMPHYPVVPSTRSLKKQALELIYFVGDQSRISQVYEDAGQGYAYTEGGYQLRTFHTESGTIKQTTTGDFSRGYKKIRFSIVGFEAVDAILTDGQPTVFSVTKNGRIELIVSEGFKIIKIS